MKFPIRTNDDFEKLMEEVDSHLQNQGIPIHARQLQAIGEVSKRFQISLRVSPLRTGPIPNSYAGESLSAHILQWFDKRYGDRLKMDLSIGYSVVMLRGDAWLLKFPVMWGTVTALCDRDLQRNYNNLVVNEAGKPQQKAMMNLLRLIEKFPQGLANRLTDDELKELLIYFTSANDFFRTIHDSCSGDELAYGSVMDLETSARFAVGHFPGYGQSLWASLQAAEKILKFYIASKGEKFPEIHNLSKLAEKAYDLGLPPIDAALIKRVQCKAEVRYEQRKYPIQKVVDAHQGAIQIGAFVTKALFAMTDTKADLDLPVGQLSPNTSETYTFDTILQPGHFYFIPKLGFSYYCHDIADNLATMIMVESYQHRDLVQMVFKQKTEYQSCYSEITDKSEIDRLKRVGDNILRDHGIT